MSFSRVSVTTDTKVRVYAIAMRMGYRIGAARQQRWFIDRLEEQIDSLDIGSNWRNGLKKWMLIVHKGTSPATYHSSLAALTLGRDGKYRERLESLAEDDEESDDSDGKDVLMSPAPAPAPVLDEDEWCRTPAPVSTK